MLNASRLIAGALSGALVVVLPGLPAARAAAPESIAFAPHRAVYEISFDHATPGSGVADMSGRMVYEMTGSSCEGFAQNMRFVTRTTNQDGIAQISDLRTSSYEDLAIHLLRFASSQYENQKLSEASQGSAAPANGATFTKVELTKPAKKIVKLPSDIYFPVQHSIALTEAARAGKTMFVANLYDGADKGEKFYETSAVIGEHAAPGGVKAPAGVANAEKLDQLTSWPIAIGYFEPGLARADTLPTYELSYRFYENGVSTQLLFDYGDFAIRGELKELTFLPQGKCPAPKH